jgi:hypothetical protein
MSNVIDGDLPNAPKGYEGQYILSNIQIPQWLSKFVNQIKLEKSPSALGQFMYESKTLIIPFSIPKKQINLFITDILHEIRHSIDPKAQNEQYLKNIGNNFYFPGNIQRILSDWYDKTGNLMSYNQMILQLTESKKRLEYPDYKGNENELFNKLFQDMKKMYTKEMYEKVLKTSNSLYFNNPMEHSSQLGDIKALLSKQNLDKVREYIKNTKKQNLSDLQLRLLLKNGLNPKSRDFETFSEIINEVSGNQGSSLSQIVKNTQDPKWQEQYLKQVSNAVSVYNKDNRFLGLVRKENRMQPGVKSNPKFNLEDNAKAIKSREAFFGKVAQIEVLAEQNPKAWSRFINSNFAMKMISGKIYNLFKGIGSGSKSLSQSIKGLNMNSPYWALLEPALEFGLYQFGLFLENPSAYNLETPEQKTIRDLNARINEILANNKITDKRGYFIKNYGSYLKTLGSMEQNGLLGKFPVMGFNQFQNIGRNIGQR